MRQKIFISDITSNASKTVSLQRSGSKTGKYLGNTKLAD